LSKGWSSFGDVKIAIWAHTDVCSSGFAAPWFIVGNRSAKKAPNDAATRAIAGLNAPSTS
jgi:hypothetical protein